jgi:hypothetical protein
MSPRRVAIALAVAVLAATGAIGATAARASSSDTICVGLVIDSQQLGGGVTRGCATVPNGASGVAVLKALGHSVGFRQDGLVCTIDAKPSTGCDDVDDTHYWTYFHRPAGATSWTYSTEGPSTYRAANLATEGWVYRDGGPLTAPQNIPAHFCKTKAAPTPTPAPAHASRPVSKHHHHHHHHRSAPVTTPTATASPTPTRASRPSQRPRSRHHRHSPASRSATHHPVSPTTRQISHGAASVEPPPEGHVLLKFGIGIAVVVGLTALAFSGFRRRR